MRRTRHRRRFHTDRVVRNRRARYHHEWPFHPDRTLPYGLLADRDPWDCGRRCLLCHWDKLVEPRRTREKRAWRNDWGI